MSRSDRSSEETEAGTDPFGAGGSRIRRGIVRPLVLAALLDGPAHGYEVIRRLEQRTAGRWRPSAGSVYPTLQWFAQNGLVTARDENDKRIYALTELGRTKAEQAAARLPADPRESDHEPGCDGRDALRSAVGQLQMAARQVGQVGDPAMRDRAAAVVDGARRKLYQLLAEA